MNLQNDFLPGGVLPVPQGDRIIPLANRLQPHFNIVVATQKWHPPNHASFASNHPGRKPDDVVTIKGRKQTLSRAHCVQHTEGAKLPPNLQLTRVNRVFTIGTDVETESYSAFFDDGHLKATGLSPYLRARKITEVYVLGLMTETSVKFTALDARMLHFRTYLIEDACRSMNLQPDSVPAAIDEMKKAGVKVIQSSAVFQGAVGRRLKPTTLRA